MCIFFLFCNPRPRPGAFRLILAMNRDEVLSRPTAQADWGGQDGEGFLGGRDMEPGKEGGTWMGVDARGRLGVLTNIFSGVAPEPGAVGRGGLVAGYLKGAASAAEYADKVASDPAAYSPFNLCLLEMDLEGIYSGSYYCRGGKVAGTEGPSKLDASGFLGLGNHPPSSPFNKTTAGMEAFKEAVDKHGSASSKDSLLSELRSLMCSRDSHSPDRQMDRQAEAAGMDKEAYDARKKSLGSVFVDAGPYGTRAQSFVLVDYDKNVTFIERSRTEPGPQAEWREKSYSFKIES